MPVPTVKRLPADGFWPEEPADLLSDVLQEAIERWHGNIPATLAEFRAVVVEIAREAIECAGAETAGKAALSRRERETVARLVSEFIDAENPRMVAQCYDFAFQLGLQMGITESAIAEENRVERATVSKRCRAIVKNFDLPPARGMKSPRAVAVYRERERKRHAKRREAHRPWALADAFVGGLADATI